MSTLEFVGALLIDIVVCLTLMQAILWMAGQPVPSFSLIIWMGYGIANLMVAAEEGRK